MDRVCDRALIHKGAKFDFERVVVRGAGGREVVREVVRHPGAVVVLPVLDMEAPAADRRVVMIRNHRFTVGEELWELPAGTLEAGEEAALAAARELEEEAGYAPDRVEALGRFYTTPGMTDEMMHAFVATGLVRTRQRLEDDEAIRVEVIPAGAALAMIDSGELMDAKSMLALALGERRGVIARR